MWITWLVIAGFFFILEIATAGFLVFWLGVGALLSMILSFFVDNIFIQTGLFVISSIVLILSTKPLVKKFLDKNTVVTNAFSLIGKKAIVTEEIDSIQSKGKVKVNGEVWTALSNGEEIIAKDTEVEILEITGVKLVVKSCKEKVNI